MDKTPKQQQAATQPAAGSEANSPPGDGGVSIRKPVSTKEAKAPKKAEDGVEWGSWPDWVIVIFTLVLTWVAILQHRLEARTASETIEALRIAKQAADAASSNAFSAEKGATAAASAARATRRLVGAMTASAQAAHAAVRVSERANAVLLRPYVYIVGEKINASAVHISLQTIVSDHAPISFSIKNFGQTPAKRVRLKARAFIGEHWTEGGLVDLEETATIHRADLPPGFERKIEGYGANGMADPYARILLEECTVFFDGLIEYEDSSGAKYETRFRRACTGRQMQTGSFFITPEGNEAT